MRETPVHSSSQTVPVCMGEMQGAWERCKEHGRDARSMGEMQGAWERCKEHGITAYTRASCVYVRVCVYVCVCVHAQSIRMGGVFFCSPFYGADDSDR
jgi:hypothetical protein